MARSTSDPGALYQRVATVLQRLQGVTIGGAGRKGFGATALSVDGKIFAMLSSRDEFVVKLPRERIDALISEGRGHRFDPGHGRLMKEWLVVREGSEANWLSLAKEAWTFGRAPSGR